MMFAIALILAASTVNGNDSIASIQSTEAMVPDVFAEGDADVRTKTDAVVAAEVARQHPAKDAANALHPDAAVVVRDVDLRVDVDLAVVRFHQTAHGKPGELELLEAPVIEQGVIGDAAHHVKLHHAVVFLKQNGAWSASTSRSPGQP